MFTKLLDPKNDVAFKRIFGTDKNKEILIHFLNDMLKFKGKEPIVDVTFLPTEMLPEIVGKKVSYVDVLCKDKDGNRYIVEMQVAEEDSFIKRAQYYASKAYISQMHRGKKYEDLKEVIFLAIADFVVFPDKTAYKSDHIALDKETHEHDIKDFSFTFIELPKFKNDIDHLSTMIEKWCYFFKHADDVSPQELEKLMKSDGIIKRAYEELERHHWTEEEMLAYESADLHTRSYLATLDTSYNKGKVEGMVEGEINTKRQTAHNLLAMGLEKEKIAKVLNVSLDDLNQLLRDSR